MAASKFSKFILDTLFPISCLLCGKGSQWVCPGCLENIPITEAQVCPYCEKNISPGGDICQKCQDKFHNKNKIIPLDRLIVASSYRENNIARLVHFYKYNFVSDLSVPLGKILIKSILKNNLAIPDIIIPVPLHKRRQRWRGFNQSELLAEYVSQNLAPGMNIPVFSNFIYRVRYTKPQMKIKNYQERQKNISGIFSLNTQSSPANLSGKFVLLVDDIATTGATLFECAHVLKQNGAKKVMGIVIARQEISP